VKTRLKLVEIVGKYTGAPYMLGGFSRDEGYDCFSLVLAFAEDLGVKVPNSFSGQTMETYSELWVEDPKEAKRIMLELFGELGKEIAPHKAFASDVLILESKEGDNVGIHAGGSLVLSAFIDIGIQLVNVHNFKVTKAYRWEV